jgi:hypothetical protein
MDASVLAHGMVGWILIELLRLHLESASALVSVLRTNSLERKLEDVSRRFRQLFLQEKSRFINDICSVAVSRTWGKIIDITDF